MMANINDIYEVDTFNNKFSKIGNKLKVFSLNICSLNKHAYDLEIFLSNLNLKFDIIVLSEIRNINLNFFSDLLPNYKFLYTIPKINRTIGGVGMYIHNILKYEELNDILFENCNVESLFIDITISKSEKYIVGGIYKHPNQGLKQFQNELIKNITNIKNQNKTIMLLGDFNIDFNKLNLIPDISDYFLNLEEHGLSQLIKFPTRVTDHSSTIIDHIYLQKTNNITFNEGVIKCDITDHDATFIILNNSKLNNYKDRPLIRIYSDKNLANFKNQLEYFIKTNIAKLDWQSFFDGLMRLYNLNFPLKRLSRQNVKDKEWITKSIKKSCRKKEALYKKYKSNPTETSKLNYTRYKNTLNSLIKTAKFSYYKTYFKYDYDNKRLWSHINEKQKTRTTVQKLEQGNINLTNNIDIANCFNNFFANVGLQLAEKHNSVTINPESFLSKITTEELKFNKTNDEQIEIIIRKLKNTTSFGHDGLTTKVLKYCSKPFSLILSHLINNSILCGEFPDFMKVGKIIPIHKKGPKSQCGNYRPISLLSNLSKIFEKVIAEQLMVHMESNKLFYKNQFGFRKFNNSTHALLDSTDKIYMTQSKKKIVVGIFIDLKKAFDCVDHSILLRKLTYYGINNVTHTFFVNYLKNRSQYIIVNGCQSDTKKVTSGVPQGSILGPILYLIAVNDIQKLGNDFIALNLFADDTNVLISGNSMEELQTRCTIFLDKLYDWFSSNKLTINIEKTKFVLFERKLTNLPLSLQINNIMIEKVNSVKYLGIYLQNNLKNNLTITNLANKLKRFIHIFKHLRNYLPLNKLLMLFKSLIQSNILYGLEIYANSPKSGIKHLQLVQNAILKKLYGKSTIFNTNILHFDLKILKIEDLYKTRMCLLLFDSKNLSSNNVYLENLSNAINLPNHRYKTRNTLFKNIKANSITQNMSSYIIIKNWNELPQNIREIKKRNLFKDEIENFFLKKYVET